jgi:phosphate transport system substrate-binding protein
MKKQLFATILLFLMLLSLNACADTPAQAAAKSGDAVYIENKGSDTMVNLALAWAERYQDLRQDVRISVTGGGSGTGIAALLNNTVDLANASRQIKNEEIDKARANGTEPIEFVVARDAIAVIVHPDNPVNALTLEQLSDIYSGKISNWNEVGGEDRPIVRLSRETNSGTHVYFLEVVLRLGQSDNKTLFAQNTLLLPSSEGIIHEVRQNPNAIGYDGLGYVPHDLKVLAVADVNSSVYVRPSIETVNTGTYPIARDLYIYTAGQPTGVVKEYLDWLFSEEAQTIVADLGFVPVDKPHYP